ncbi:hypothetical protein HMPREF1051_0741 [Neisseria sicca VK64]|uniref:Uncharacterized protein n=1 Tax=Neisseria sicca VK64 TaxID=1095748 RepID=I2NQL4_NEISI|nr:hypothetical protein HMPREF1051_0741 [Neisseria sicca VK64]
MIKNQCKKGRLKTKVAGFKPCYACFQTTFLENRLRSAVNL